MNGSFYSNPVYKDNYNGFTNNTTNENPLTYEQSYIENILRLNKGRMCTLYVSFPDSELWKDREFHGIIEQAGKDHVIIKDPESDTWYMILMIYLDYVKFPNKINYSK